MAVRRAPGRASHSGPKGPDGRTPAAARGLLGESHVAYRAVLLAAFLIVVGLIFRQIVTLLLAILMTIIIAIPLSSFATALQRRRIPRPLGALCGLLLGLGALAGLIALVTPPFVREVNRLVKELPGIATSVERKLHTLTGSTSGSTGHSLQHFAQRYTSHPEKLLDPIASVGLGVAGVLGGIVVILLTAYYIAIRPDPLVTGALRLFPPPLRPRVTEVMARIRVAFVGWLRGLVAAMLIVGVLLYLGLTIVGLKFAIFFAVFSAIAETVPYFGAIASGIPPVLFALTYSPGKALVVLLIYVGIHQLEGNVIAPLIMARAVRLHPAVIAFGVVVVGELFGIIGLIVAVPIIALTVILVEEIWIKPAEERAGAAGAM